MFKLRKDLLKINFNKKIPKNEFEQMVKKIQKQLVDKEIGKES